MNLKPLQFAGLISLLMLLPSWAQSVADGLYDCDSIVVAKFLDYSPKDRIGYKYPPIANYRVCVLLKGPPCAANDLPVRYSFSENDNEAVPLGWAFKRNMMPRKNSIWILFINHAMERPPGGVETFRGSKGRIEFTKTTGESVLKEIERRGDRSAWYKSLDMGEVFHEVDLTRK